MIKKLGSKRHIVPNQNQDLEISAAFWLKAKFSFKANQISPPVATTGPTSLK